MGCKRHPKISDFLHSAFSLARDPRYPAGLREPESMGFWPAGFLKLRGPGNKL